MEPLCRYRQQPRSSGTCRQAAFWHLALVGVLGIAAGCSAIAPEPCSDSRLAAAATAAVEKDQTLEEFVAGNPACSLSRDSVADAYATALSGYCDPARAWVAGRQDQGSDGVCQSRQDRWWREAYNLGRQLKVFELQLQEVDQELALLAGNDQASQRIGQLNLLRIKLIREIESISGVAQVRGWGPQLLVD